MTVHRESDSSEGKRDRDEEIIRLIALLQAIQSSSTDPFAINIKEKLLLLKKQLPQWKFLDELLLDSEALYQLVQIVKLQEQWLKHRASSLYIDPLLLELKIRLLSKEGLADSLVKSWHPVVQIDQLSPRGLEKAFTYWRDLTPISERFKESFGSYGNPVEKIEYEELIRMRIFTKEQFESQLKAIYNELIEKADKDQGVDYRRFINSEDFETTVIRAYLMAFLVTEGKAVLHIDPLSEKITLFPVFGSVTQEATSVAIEVSKVKD
jgi:hypothetical protein